MELINESPELKILLKRAIKSKHGLYPHELLMLNYAHTYTTGSNKFQQFWQSLYFVNNPQLVLDSLYERGFIQPSEFKKTLENLKLPQLKEELKAYNQKTSGKKSDLIERLITYGDISTLEKKYTTRYYELTKLGESELKENEYISYIHKHNIENLTIWDMNIMLGNDYKSSYKDKLWEYLNENSEQHIKNNNFGLYRNTRLFMYYLLIEDKKYDIAFNFICEVAYYDLSGLGNNELIGKKVFYKSALEDELEMAFPYEESCFILPPAIISYLMDMQERLSEEVFRKRLLSKFKEIKTIFHLFTEDECVDIVIAEINNDTSTLKKIYKQSEKRLKAKIRTL